MSTTTTTDTAQVSVTTSSESAAPQTPGESIWGVIQLAASKALGALTLVSNKWYEIKADPLYGTLVKAAVDSANKTLETRGVPVTDLVDIEGAVEDLLGSMAKAHPLISTAVVSIR